MKRKTNNNYLVIKDMIKNNNLFISTKRNSSNKLAFILKLIPFTVLSIISTESLSVLSATTANTIKGNAPYLVLPDNSKLTDVNQLFGITLPKSAGSEDKIEIAASESSTTIYIPEGIKFSEVITTVLADGNPQNVTGANVADDDGDADLSSNATINGNITATWYNGAISASYKVTDLNQVIPVCGGPYYLRIESTAVQVNTTYGDPQSKDYASRVITYTLSMNKHGICYVQPDLTVWSGTTNAEQSINKWPYQNESNPGGYNPNKWIYENGKHKGFMKDSGFPTTGFNRAEFKLIGASNDQSKYLCELDSSNSENWVTLSGTAAKAIGQNCIITYDKVERPTTPVKINMKYYDGTDWIKIDSYTIPKPTLWAVKGTNATKVVYNTAQDFSGVYNAAISCGAPAGLSGKENQAVAAQYFFKRNELTNSPVANLAPPSMLSAGRFARDVDGTFTGEWGWMNKYASAGWDVSPYNVWTSEATTEKGQYLVLAHGYIHANYSLTAESSAMCKK